MCLRVHSLDCHIVEIEIFGPGDDTNRFHVKTVRRNPAKSGAVTGNATYSSFLSSMLGKYITQLSRPYVNREKRTSKPQSHGCFNTS